MGGNSCSIFLLIRVNTMVYLTNSISQDALRLGILTEWKNQYSTSCITCSDQLLLTLKMDLFTKQATCTEHSSSVRVP
jgi:hypothetical protein